MPIEPTEADPPKRQRRWCQFSLRTLFVVVTIVAVACAVCLPMLRVWQNYNSIEERFRRVGKLLEEAGDIPDIGPLCYPPKSQLILVESTGSPSI